MSAMLGRLAQGQMTRAEFETAVCQRGDGKVVRVRDATREDLDVHSAWLAAELAASEAEVTVAEALMARIEPHVRDDESIADAVARGAIPATARPAALALIALHEQWTDGAT
jgi:hypothetical protein